MTFITSGVSAELKNVPIPGAKPRRGGVSDLIRGTYAICPGASHPDEPCKAHGFVRTDESSPEALTGWYRNPLSPAPRCGIN
jgi:hypothetical protein